MQEQATTKTYKEMVDEFYEKVHAMYDDFFHYDVDNHLLHDYGEDVATVAHNLVTALASAYSTLQALTFRAEAEENAEQRRKEKA